jgi:hypothetical protein
MLDANVADAKRPEGDGLELYLDVEVFVADECDAKWDDSAIKSTKVP